MAWAGREIDALEGGVAQGGLLGEVGRAAGNLGDALDAIREVGCSGSEESFGVQLGLADALSYNGTVLASLTMSIDPTKVPQNHATPAAKLRGRMDDLAFRFTLAGAQLHALAGGVQPLEVSHGPASDPCPCCPKDGGSPVDESQLLVPEPDFEAASEAVRCVGPLVRDQRVATLELMGFMAPILLAIGCANSCGPCNAVLAGPTAGALTVANNGTGRWDATQVVNWTLCCCNWCWVFWTDFWRTPKTTTVTWNTGVPWTRPAGAALAVARRTAARRVAAAAPPAC